MNYCLANRAATMTSVELRRLNADTQLFPPRDGGDLTMLDGGIFDKAGTSQVYL
jgi:hypothetical protein